MKTFSIAKQLGFDYTW